jgi:hypothetical protein
MYERITAAFVPDNNAGVIAAALLTEQQCEDSRANAAECQEIATYWPDLLKRQYEDLARQWLLLAEQSERNRRYIAADDHRE